MPFTDNADLFNAVQTLVEDWCDRRCLKALSWILRGYPLTSPLGDGWGDLLVALQNVRAFAQSELTDAERAAVDECIRAVDSAVHRTVDNGSPNRSVQTAQVSPYHTNSMEYPPPRREVYHDRNDCPDGKRIKREHRENGTGNKKRCDACSRLG
jgi:hypothetical protein